MLDGVFKLEDGTAKDLSSDWVEKFVSTQADFIRATSQAYLGAFKDRLKYSRCPSTAPDVRRSGRLRKTPPGKRACPSGARHAAVTQYSLRTLAGRGSRSSSIAWNSSSVGSLYLALGPRDGVGRRRRCGTDSRPASRRPRKPQHDWETRTVRRAQRPIEFGVGERGTDVEETASNRKTSSPPNSGRPYHPPHASTWPHWSARRSWCLRRGVLGWCLSHLRPPAGVGAA